ncbi:hypothetical protein DFH09DRAFT_1190380 [Mycena vulgaris]|nr:hypothetical protein DFH09DRAFT_1190380 [Mycena vulgaris]
MALAGKAAGKDVGMWFGPSAAAGAVRTLVDAFPACGLGVSVAADGTLYRRLHPQTPCDRWKSRVEKFSSSIDDPNQSVSQVHNVSVYDFMAPTVRTNPDIS